MWTIANETRFVGVSLLQSIRSVAACRGKKRNNNLLDLVRISSRILVRGPAQPGLAYTIRMSDTMPNKQGGSVLCTDYV